MWIVTVYCNVWSEETAFQYYTIKTLMISMLLKDPTRKLALSQLATNKIVDIERVI